MLVQGIGIYNQFSINRNQQKYTKNPIGFGMMLKIGEKEEEIIKRLVGSEEEFKKVKDFIDGFNIPEKMAAFFSKCYQELYPNESKAFTPEMCRDFDIALPELRLFEKLNEEGRYLSVFITEEIDGRSYAGVGDVGSKITPKTPTSSAISPEDLIEKIRKSFESFAKERISVDTSRDLTVNKRISFSEFFKD